VVGGWFLREGGQIFVLLLRLPQPSPTWTSLESSGNTFEVRWRAVGRPCEVARRLARGERRKSIGKLDYKREAGVVQRSYSMPGDTQP